MIWILKAFIQKSISILPFSYRISYLFQRYYTVGRDLPDYFVMDRLNHALNHIDSFNKWSNVPIGQAKIFEIGTGWYPIVPIVCFLSGSNDVETSDIRKLYSKQSINQTIRAFLKLYDNKSIFKLIPNLQVDRIETLKLALNEKRVSDKLSLLKIRTILCKENNYYHITSNTKDLIVSNNTIQLIEKIKLNSVISDVYRIGNPNSVISLAIDFTDDFSHFDKSISNYNFLKYSENAWRIISNRLSRNIRLRYSDYQRMLSMNFQIVYEKLNRGESHELKNINIHKMFSHYNLSDLLVKHAYLVAINNKN